MNFDIRTALPGDAEIIASNNSLMAEETEGKPLAPGVIRDGVENVLNDADKGQYWVAEGADSVIGQIMVTYEWSDWRNARLWWIQSVYVHSDYRRQGVFSALYRHVENAAKVNGAGGLRLYVETNNKRALQTYLALGMVDPHYQVMETIFGDDPC